jgi:hypothetical protein
VTAVVCWLAGVALDAVCWAFSTGVSVAATWAAVAVGWPDTADADTGISVAVNRTSGGVALGVFAELSSVGEAVPSLVGSEPEHAVPTSTAMARLAAVNCFAFRQALCWIRSDID